jgi:hypothetical protein
MLEEAPRELAENLAHPAAIVIASMLRRRVDFRPNNALEAWKAFAAVL